MRRTSNPTERVPGALSPKGLLWAILLFLVLDIAVYRAVRVIFRNPPTTAKQDELRTLRVDVEKRLAAVEKSAGDLGNDVSVLKSEVQNTNAAVSKIEKVLVTRNAPRKERTQVRRQGK